ncbi:MAG: hypothetical protein CL773_05195 [Chloroflexi bacterium]|nr:hypothetical protein [Chloroflexota bacterium]|tara:strand:- start:5277 stop:5468 length:192 start_codon:yes stop_codon:yes gene_type:complete
MTEFPSKEMFLNLLKSRKIKLSKEDFDQSYLSFINFRKNYKEMLNDDFKDFEPRQRIFDLSDE